MRDHVDTIAPISAAGPAPGSKYDRLIARAKETRPAITVVVHPCDEILVAWRYRGGGTRHH